MRLRQLYLRTHQILVEHLYIATEVIIRRLHRIARLARPLAAAHIAPQLVAHLRVLRVHGPHHVVEHPRVATLFTCCGRLLQLFVTSARLSAGSLLDQHLVVTRILGHLKR